MSWSGHSIVTMVGARSSKAGYGIATASEQLAAFDEIARLLSTAAAVSARAIRAHPLDTPARAALEQHLGHTLDRLALLHGRGTYENLSTAEILQIAVDNEVRLAIALDEQAAAAATTRARSLVDAARRGVRLHVREPAPSVRLYRGVYVEPLRPELEQLLWQRREPYLRWREGAVVVLDEDEVDTLRAAGIEVDVLFLDPDESARPRRWP